MAQEGAHFLKLFQNVGIGLKDVHAGKVRHGGKEAGSVIKGRIDFKAVFQAHFIVLGAMAGCCMDAACAGIKGNMVAKADG